MESENIQFKKIGSKLMSCPNCFALNDDLTEFCHQCDSRLGSNLTPLGIARSEADVLGKVTTIKPKFIVLLGTWIIFFPVLLTAIVLGINQVLYVSGSNGFIFFWFSMAMIVVSSTFLYRVTSNYFTMEEKKWDDNLD